MTWESTRRRDGWDSPDDDSKQEFRNQNRSGSGDEKRLGQMIQ